MKVNEIEKSDGITYKNGFNVFKKFLFISFLIVAIAALGLLSFSSYEQTSGNPNHSTLNSLASYSNLPSFPSQQNLLFLESYDSVEEDFKVFPDVFSVINPNTLYSSNFNLHVETLLDSINTFHYVSTYGFSPLRSPPLFS